VWGCEAKEAEVEVEELTDNRFSHMQKDRQPSGRMVNRIKARLANHLHPSRRNNTNGTIEGGTIQKEELTDNRLSHMQKGRQPSWSYGKED
jgi:hypothetical protein